MKTKTIKAILRKKFDKFLKSIDDPKVKTLVKNNSIITGGCIASMLKKEPVNDYDIYFTNKETVLAVCEYYINKFTTGDDEFRTMFEILDDAVDEDNGRVKIRVKSEGVAAEVGFKFDEQEEDIDIEDNFTNLSVDVEEVEPIYAPYRPVYISANAITLSHKMQLILRFYGDADEIHSNYDFAHCTCYWTSKDSNLVLPSEALECLLTDELRYRGSKYPLASIIRTRKFINRGMTINAGQYLKMCMQLNDLDLRDLSVLEDQLIGVDAAYFAMLLAAIPDTEKINNRIDSNYLIRMVDKFF